MALSGAIRALTHLAKIGHYKLANKILDSIKTGKVLHLTGKERKAWNVVGHDVKTNLQQEFRTPHPKTNILRREFYDMYRGGQHGQGALSRSYFQRTRSTPMVDIDFDDAISHAAKQVVFKGKEGKANALKQIKDFLKSKAGGKHAYKIYDTPAGLRLIDVSKHGRGKQMNKYGDIMDILGADPSYKDRALEKAKNYGLSVYDARLMPKPGRPNDFTARLLSQIKGKGAELSPSSLIETRDMHDNLIKTILKAHDEKQIIRLPGLLGKVDFRKMS